MNGQQRRAGRGLTLGDAARLLDLPVEDARFLRQLGALRVRDAWALSEPTFDRAAVERCRRWLEEQAQAPPELIARLRREKGAELINPEGLISPGSVGLAWNLYGRHYWQAEVGSSLREGLNRLRLDFDMEPLEDIALLPPEWRAPTNFFIVPPEMVHIAIFMGDAAATWGVGKALDRVAPLLTRTAKHNDRFWRKEIAEAFWFVVSVWHGTEAFWAVIASDVSPGIQAAHTQLLPGYEKILRARRRGRSKGRSRNRNGSERSSEAGQDDPGQEAIVAILRHGQLLPRCRSFPTLEEALRNLGRVEVVSSGGPLEALWKSAHPRSFSGLRLCQILQSRPGIYLQEDQLALESKCSRPTVRDVLRELTTMKAPLRHEPPRGWMYYELPAG